MAIGTAEAIAADTAEASVAFFWYNGPQNDWSSDSAADFSRQYNHLNGKGSVRLLNTGNMIGFQSAKEFWPCTFKRDSSGF